MGTKKSKVDTTALFRGIVGHDESEAPEVNSGEAEAAAKLPVAEEVKAAPVKVGRKPNKEKNIQVSIYPGSGKGAAGSGRFERKGNG